MNTNESRSTGSGPVIIAVALIGVVGLGLTYERWSPLVSRGSASTPENSSDESHGDSRDHSSHPHAHGDAAHEGHDDASALELSAAAWKNVGLRTRIVMPQTYARTITVPAIVTERPGRSQVQLTAPFTGIVTQIFLIEGEVIQPGEPMFTLRLTHEDLVTAQRSFLQAAQELDVVQNEIKRLSSVSESIAGRRVVEQEYEKQKIEAMVHAQRQGLLLHGLNDAQIDAIIKTRTLLQSLTVKAPPFANDGDHQELDHVYHVQLIDVQRGQHVTAGNTLGVLADHCMLYVEGQAFEDDADRLTQAAQESWQVSVARVATVDNDSTDRKLQVFYVADHIDPESRALKFYLNLPNSLARDEQRDSHRFVAWKYRPGQRMQVKIPTAEPWDNQIVLPIDAVVEDGAEWFVFQQNGDHFDRKSVHLIYRDRDTAVIENDGKLSGTTLAMSGAYQMNLALKNKAGDGVDPHAGHTH
ncbi:MAG: efflux RND transporter periplasmic adaptor subunit [Planctomycetes bacterium]|nr:efflux RND transporter periplasmic adaptor subunit [Planctomycetota bacterium]